MKNREIRNFYISKLLTLRTSKERAQLAGNVRNQTAITLPMLNWTITFLILAVIAGVFGFTDLVGAAAGISRILFVIFLILLAISGFSRVLASWRS